MGKIELIESSDLEKQLDLEQFEALLKAYRQEVLAERSGLGEIEPPYGISDLVEGFEGSYGFSYFIAMEDDTIQGFLGFEENSGILYETRLMVRDDFREKGLDTRLRMKFFEYAGEREIQACILYNATAGGYASFLSAVEEMGLTCQTEVSIGGDEESDSTTEANVSAHRYEKLMLRAKEEYSSIVTTCIAYTHGKPS